MVRPDKAWLLLVDLDGTLWTHHDISTLTPPFQRIAPLTIKSSDGVIVRAYEHIVETIRWARRNNAIVSTLSWNTPWIALEALHAMGLDPLFDYHAIEPHPHKDRMILKLLTCIRLQRKISIPPNRIVYLDDRTIHLDEIMETIGAVHYIDPRTCKTTKQCISRIKQELHGLGFMSGAPDVGYDWCG